MPKHRGIHIALVSQYDAKLIPEHCSPDESDDDAGRESQIRTIDTYISNYAASQFWIRYACDMSTQGLETRFFYFKLYVAGTFAVAWGCGAQDEWEGKTLFVPKNVGREKLGLFFPRDIEGTSQAPTLEIRVCRAKARRRQERQYAPTAELQGTDGAVQYGEPAIAQIGVTRSLTKSSLVWVGTIKSREPQRFYTYALLDPKEKPYACFRYYCLAHEELRRCGFQKRGARAAQPPQDSREVLRDCIGFYLDSLPASHGEEHGKAKEHGNQEDVLPSPTDFRPTRQATD
ncbi:hypothetical protein Q7P35_003695 [Cladosporium inversicolor]